MLLLLPLALAADPSASVRADPPLPLAGDPVEVLATAYLLPAPDPAFLTDESEWRQCVVTGTLGADGTARFEAADCPEGMRSPCIDASTAWSFEAPGEATRISITYRMRYVASLGTTSLHAEVDPGHDAAQERAQGLPGVKLVRPAELARPIKTRLPRAAKKAGLEGGTCALGVKVGVDGRAVGVEVRSCPESLQEDAVKRALKGRWWAHSVDGLPMPSVSELVLEY